MEPILTLAEEKSLVSVIGVESVYPNNVKTTLLKQTHDIMNIFRKVSDSLAL